MEKLKITSERIDQFFAGHDPMERIVDIECEYTDDLASVIYVDEHGVKRVQKDKFYPFIWAKNSACIRLFGGDRKLIAKKLKEYGIKVKALTTHFDGQEVHERIDKGYKYMFYAERSMSYGKFLTFFNEAGVPVHPRGKNQEKSQEYLAVSPLEQYMMATGRRLFKGYEAYDDTKRLIFDLETQGLDPKIHGIDQIGVRINKGFRTIIPIEGEGEARKKSELMAIIRFVKIISEEKPDVIIGHNSENFDWYFIIERCKVLGSSMEEISKIYLAHPIYKKTKDAVLKLGGEVEYYKPTVIWGFSVIDSLHAARRAQATNSQMASANLKYLADFFHVKRANRVYVKGDKIGTIWLDTEEHFAFNDDNGDYYVIDEKHPLKEGYAKVSGRYVIERYLQDDLEETDKIEVILNESNFQVCKVIPTSFTRACTMGTAGIWKLIMLAWSYENNLAVPAFSPRHKFTGGLSRLLLVGRIPKASKHDANSMYPTITLNYDIKTGLDITDAMSYMLDNRLMTRELYKGKKKAAGKEIEVIKEKLPLCNGEDNDNLLKELEVQERIFSVNDKIQSSSKVICNSYFGSFGAPNIFPWGDLECAEKITCIGRMMLRVMIYHFSHISEFNGVSTDCDYQPVVGDSFTADTPLFIRYRFTHRIDIQPISELIDEAFIEKDYLGREYDYSRKPFEVLCRSGWVEPQYIYRHATDKAIYKVTDGDMCVEVTEDHSLFNDKKEKIKPSEIRKDTKLEYYSLPLHGTHEEVSEKEARMMARWLRKGSIDRVPMNILNASKYIMGIFMDELNGWDFSQTSKTCQAGVLFLQSRAY